MLLGSKRHQREQNRKPKQPIVSQIFSIYPIHSLICLILSYQIYKDSHFFYILQLQYVMTLIGVIYFFKPLCNLGSLLEKLRSQFQFRIQKFRFYHCSGRYDSKGKVSCTLCFTCELPIISGSGQRLGTHEPIQSVQQSPVRSGHLGSVMHLPWSVVVVVQGDLLLLLLLLSTLLLLPCLQRLSCLQPLDLPLEVYVSVQLHLYHSFHSLTEQYILI